MTMKNSILWFLDKGHHEWIKNATWHVLDVVSETIYYIISMKAIFRLMVTSCNVVFYWIWKPQDNTLISHKDINQELSNKGQWTL